MSLMPAPNPRPGWLPDEVANAGRENLDSVHAAQYDTKEDASADTEVSLCRELGLGAESIVVEIGAGTGQFAMAIAPYCARVIAVDVSPVMLEVLRAKQARASLKNVEVVQAGFLTYEHVQEPADLVYSRYALHHLPDFWKAVALAHIHRMLRPGGLVRLWDVVYGFEPAEAEQEVEAWCATLDGATSADGWQRTDIEEHVRDEYSTFTWLLEPMISRSGFRIEAAYYSDGIFAKYVLRSQ